jgi:hypothetical protein
MRSSAFLVVLLVVMALTPVDVMSLTPGDAHYLSDAEVEVAIAAGLKAQPKPIACYADVRFAEAVSTDFSRGYSLSLRGPVTNIGILAAEAKQKNLTFTKDDVIGYMKLRALNVLVLPHAPEFWNKRWQHAAPATHLVVRIPAPNKEAVSTIIEPVKVSAFPVHWDGFGAEFNSQGVAAVFDLGAIPVEQDIEFVVVTEHGERDCRLSKNDRARIR